MVPLTGQIFNQLEALSRSIIGSYSDMSSGEITISVFVLGLYFARKPAVASQNTGFFLRVRSFCIKPNFACVTQQMSRQVTPLKKMTRSRLQSKLNGMFLRLGALRLANLKLHNFLKLFSVYLTNKLKNRAHRKDRRKCLQLTQSLSMGPSPDPTQCRLNLRYKLPAARCAAPA